MLVDQQVLTIFFYERPAPHRPHPICYYGAYGATQCPIETGKDYAPPVIAPLNEVLSGKRHDNLAGQWYAGAFYSHHDDHAQPAKCVVHPLNERPDVSVFDVMDELQNRLLNRLFVLVYRVLCSFPLTTHGYF
jgi:hypothetical protein